MGWHRLLVGVSFVLVGSIAVTAHADDAVIDAHGEAITVPLLEGFEQLTDAKLAELGMRDTGIGNRTLAVFAEHGLLRNIESGKLPSHMRYLDVQISREFSPEAGTRAGFALIMTEIKKGGLASLTKEELARLGKPGQVGGVSNVIYEHERYAVLHMDHTANGQREDVGMAFVLVRARVISLYVRSMPGSDDEGKWATETAKNWAESIIEANPPTAASQKAEAKDIGGGFWSGVFGAGMRGAVIGGIAGLLAMLWRKRASR